MSADSDSPTFSIIVPTRARPSQLERCLAAVAGLDFPPERFEVLVVNDGEDSDTDAVVASWQGRSELTPLWSGGAGPSAARNAGIEGARGRYIAFTDDDCEPEPDWLLALEEALEANQGCAVGGRMVNGATGRCAAGSQLVLEAAYAHFNRDPANPVFFATSNLAFPAEALRRIGSFDEDLLHAEDRELCDRWIWSGLRLVGAPAAIVRHMRELSLREFWRQHFGYGRGAWSIHRARAQRHQGHFKVEPGFYGELGRQISDSKEHGRLTLTALAVTSQAANAAGFACEGIAARLGRSQHMAPLEASE